MSARRYELPHELPPPGITVASYETYAEAVRAIDYLCGRHFPVEKTAIVGDNLRRVETVTGRLTWVRALGTGATIGAWLGLPVGLLVALLSPANGWITSILTGLILGAMFGAALAATSYSQLRGRRGFVSRSAVIATTYDVLCDAAHLEEARNHLATLALKGEVFPVTKPSQPSPSGRRP